ncbi:hypothetical protein [Butyrivibrio sp. INlla21]|uniref:hypothetical protein n=1 Tax=Butyrivibrio sp. INlla21 TaxID=1520811 RepID=UPI0008E328A7|nr:hypothetical protein [Butyrivibrio sp. INlla21]SFU70082.1 hypothetical protein SAMN02910342_01414 [Butyrivibrio sp. INlla21]
MAHRFRFKESLIYGITGDFYRWFSVIIFILVAVFVFLAIDASGKSTIEKQQESLENAIARDIVQCYAIEGRYPPSLSYIEEHYGLVYDDATFFVDYRPVASNLYPDVTVIKVNK